MPELKIGRNNDCDIVINDLTVSRLHAILIIGESAYSIKDNGSANGTFVNGSKISAVYSLKENDIVKVGNTVIPWRNYITSQPSFSTSNKSKVVPVKKEKKKKPVSTMLAASVMITALLVSLVIYFFYISQKDELRISATWVCDKNCGDLTRIIFDDAKNESGNYTYITHTVVTDTLKGAYYINTEAKLLRLNPGPIPATGSFAGITKTEVTYKYNLSKNDLSLTLWNNGVKEGLPITLAKLR